MTTVNLADYKDIYMQTAREYLESLSKSCEKLLDNPIDKDALNQLHISSHSLRSQSQVMGYANIGNLTGVIEKTARAGLEGNVSLTNDSVMNIKRDVEELEEMLKLVQHDRL